MHTQFSHNHETINAPNWQGWLKGALLLGSSVGTYFLMLTGLPLALAEEKPELGEAAKDALMLAENKLVTTSEKPEAQSVQDTSETAFNSVNADSSEIVKFKEEEIPKVDSSMTIIPSQADSKKQVTIEDSSVSDSLDCGSDIAQTAFDEDKRLSHCRQLASDYIRALFSNHNPTDILLSNYVMKNNTENGTVIGYFNTIDLDIDDKFNYTLVNGEGDTANGLFAISNNTLKAHTLVYARPVKGFNDIYFDIRVETNDGYGGTFQKSFKLVIKDTDWFLWITVVGVIGVIGLVIVGVISIVSVVSVVFGAICCLDCLCPGLPLIRVLSFFGSKKGNAKEMEEIDDVNIPGEVRDSEIQDEIGEEEENGVRIVDLTEELGNGEAKEVTDNRGAYNNNEEVSRSPHALFHLSSSVDEETDGVIGEQKKESHRHHHHHHHHHRC